DHKQETGWLVGEATANTFALVTAAKYAFGRSRPLEGNRQGEFRTGGQSFPSEHSAFAWAAATVLAHEYPNPAMQVLAYGTAAAVSAGRVVGKQHFPSDVLIGGALGYYIGRQVYRVGHDPEKGGADYGEFVRTPESERSVESMAAAYVPVDSWVYPAFDRLT